MESKDSNAPVKHNMLSSIFYFFLLQFNWIWNIVNTVIIAIIQAMKIYQFPLKDVHRDFLMTTPFVLFVLCAIKIGFAKSGNRGESALYMAFAIFFTLTCIAMDVYLIAFQPYLWGWELPFHIISIIIEGIIFLFSVLMLIVFIAKGN
jgi:hypothetical protein